MFSLASQDISDESDDEKQAKKNQIQTLYAFDLFSNKFFKDSMKEFAKLQTDPCDVIRLFPDLWPQDSLMSTPSKHTNASTAAARSILPKLVDKDLELGLLALIDYLTEVRHKLQKDLHSSDAKTSQNTNRLFVIIDTTLLKCYLQVRIFFLDFSIPLIDLIGILWFLIRQMIRWSHHCYDSTIAIWKNRKRCCVPIKNTAN